MIPTNTLSGRRTPFRALLVPLLLLLGLVLFSACAHTDAPSTSWTSADTDAVTYFARIVKTNAEARQMFTAAARGYDMSAEGFDDSQIEIGALGGEVSLSGARAALDKVAPADDASKNYFNTWRDELTAEQVGEIVTRMSDEVDISDQGANPMVWIGKFLKLLTNITPKHNYVLALFLFALLVELLLLPFGIKQQQNSIKQAKLRPKEMAIRKKYSGRNDQVTQRKMNEEIQKLYQEEGFNPMGGCLPMLIQMPIVIILYNIVVDPLRYVLGKAEGLSTAISTFCSTARAAGGLGESLSSSRGTIEALSRLKPELLDSMRGFSYFSNASACADALNDAGAFHLNFDLFGTNMGLIPGFRPPYLLLLVPVLTFLFYFASMKLSRKLTYQPATDPQMGCSNQVMDITMPLMSVYIAFIVPAAIGIYWIFKCILGMAKQYALYKLMPLPTFTEEDYKAAERAAKGKGPKSPRPSGDGRPVRSLHHIDDEDDEPPRSLPEPEEEEDEDEPEDGSDSGPAQNSDNRSGLSAPLKEDRKNGGRQKK